MYFGLKENCESKKIIIKEGKKIFLKNFNVLNLSNLCKEVMMSRCHDII